MARPRPITHTKGIAHLCILKKKKKIIKHFCGFFEHFSPFNKALLVFPYDGSSLFRHVCLLLPVPDVEEDEEEEDDEGVGGEGAVVQEGVKLAQRLAGAPTHHIHSLEHKKNSQRRQLFINYLVMVALTIAAPIRMCLTKMLGIFLARRLSQHFLCLPAIDHIQKGDRPKTLWCTASRCRK